MKVFPTGIRNIDKVLGGGFPGESISMICGRPGMGKTTVAAQIAVNMARNGTKVLWIDMSLNEPVLAYFVYEASKDKTVKSNLDYHGISFRTSSIGNVSYAAMKSDAEVVFVDYIQLIAGHSNGTGLLEFATKGLTGKAFVFLSQLPRSVDDREGGRPSIEDAKGIVYYNTNTDKTILLYREAYYTGIDNGGSILCYVYDGETYAGVAALPYDPSTVYEPFLRTIKQEENE